MAEPLRPGPQAGWRTRAGDTLRGWPWRETAALAAVGLMGACLLLIGVLWGWREWSNRSEPAIDDLLTPLATGDGANPNREPADTAASDDAASADVDRRSADVAGDPSQGGSMLADRAGLGEPASTEPRVEPTPEPTPTPAPIVVHVSGAVTEPGVVELPAGARVFEAVDAAGGVSGVADTNRINLAAPLVDGERVHVPAVGEEAAPTLIEPDRPSPTPLSVAGGAGRQGTTPTPASPTPTPGPIDLNRATPAELEQLPGVGPMIAQAIADLRDQRGPYYSVDELLLVDGIGPAKLEALRPHAWVQPS